MLSDVNLLPSYLPKKKLHDKLHIKLNLNLNSICFAIYCMMCVLTVGYVTSVLVLAIQTFRN